MVDFGDQNPFADQIFAKNGNFSKIWPFLEKSDQPKALGQFSYTVSTLKISQKKAIFWKNFNTQWIFIT